MRRLAALSLSALLFATSLAARAEAATFFEVTFDLTILVNECRGFNIEIEMCRLDIPDAIVGETYSSRITAENKPDAVVPVDFSRNWSYDASEDKISVKTTCSIGPYACPLGNPFWFTGRFNYDTNTGYLSGLGNYSSVINFSGTYWFEDDQNEVFQVIRGAVSNVNGRAVVVPLPAGAVLLGTGLLGMSLLAARGSGRAGRRRG
jgi:hypothetical protein